MTHCIPTVFVHVSFSFIVNRVKEGTGVVINISENNGSNIIRIEGNFAGVLKAQTVCNIHFHRIYNIL